MLATTVFSPDQALYLHSAVVNSTNKHQLSAEKKIHVALGMDLGFSETIRFFFFVELHEVVYPRNLKLAALLGVCAACTSLHAASLIP